MLAGMTTPDFAAPIEDRWFEDYKPGAVYEYGYATLTADELVDFATRFDPQPMHVDPLFAKTGPFGGLIASGWHTAGLMRRLLADNYLSRVAGLPSPGVDELRWPHPVRPGDVLRLRVEILEARESRSKPDRGVIRTKAELLNQDDAVVLSMIAVNMVAKRP
jgi:acyl dehydratase